MKYLIIHNRYSRVGGEESVVVQQMELLRSAGHEVVLYERSYDEIRCWRFGRLTSSFSAIYNLKSIKDIKKIVADFSPNVAIVHNLFPVISPAILPILKKRGVTVLMTVHNYRLICPTGVFFRKKTICEKCGTGLREFNCLVYNCQGTIFGSFAFAIRSFYSRITKKYTRNVDVFLVLSAFQKKKLAQYGLPEAKIQIAPNFVNPRSEIISNENDGYVGFVGRLSIEKGVDFLFDIARNMPNVEFRVAGEVGLKLCDIPGNVKLVGFLSKPELDLFYQRAALIISTSLWYEGFPLSIIDAMIYAKPVLVPNIAVFPQMVDHGQCGMLYQTGNLSDALDKLSNLLNNKELQIKLGNLAKEKTAKEYSPDNYLSNILSNSYKK